MKERVSDIGVGPGEVAAEGAAGQLSDRNLNTTSWRQPSDPSRLRQTIFRRALGVADAAAVTFALVSSSLLAGGKLTLATLLVPPIFILIAKTTGLYDRDAELLHKTTLDEVPKLFALSTSFVLLLWLAGDPLVDGEISRAQVALLWANLLLGLICLRSIARVVSRTITPIERCLFVGDRAVAPDLEGRLSANPSVNAKLVAWIHEVDADGGLGGECSLPERIRSQIAEHDIHRVIMGPGASGDEILDAVRQIRDNGVKVSVLPNEARMAHASVELDRLDGITLLGLRRFEITLSSRLIKRTFDLASSSLALAVASPVLVVTAVAVKLDSRGPVLFRQARAGRHGEVFQMLKFRSMEDGADEQKEGLRHLNEAEGVFKIAGDPRITRVGRVIRQLHIDELPQLVNVLRGEMSLVGPRPLPLDEDLRIEGWHRRRLDLRPGITGPWQVMGSSRVPVGEMVKIDYRYVAEWTLWNDLRIVFLTLGHIVRRRGL